MMRKREYRPLRWLLLAEAELRRVLLLGMFVRTYHTIPEKEEFFLNVFISIAA